MGLGNLIKREIAITICTVLLVSTTFLMFSYSIFKVDKETPADTIKFGDIALRMCVDSKCDENINNLDNVIGIETTTDSNGSVITKHIPIFPTNDPTTAEEWASLKPYTFELTNTGSLDLYVTILLEKDETSLTLTEERKTPSGTTSITYNEQVDDSEVKIGFGEAGATSTIKLYSDTLDSSDNKHKISKNILLKAGETRTYNLYAWLRSDAQNASQGKYFITNITAKGEYLPNGTKTLSAKLLEDNPTISTRSDFSKTFTTTNIGTLYTSTESIANGNASNVYYFAGNAQNNWVKFGKWQSDKISVVGSNEAHLFKEYNSIEDCENATSFNKNCETVTFANKGDDMYWRIIRTNSDGSIRLLYSGTSTNTTIGYIGISSFNTNYNSPKDVGYMYGNSDTTPEEARANENNSAVKTYIDNWYVNNLTSYTNYLSSKAVYCNDREIESGTYNTTGELFQYVQLRMKEYTPTYNCTNTKDAFSVNNSEAKLNYPIALMTIDEVMFSGGTYLIDGAYNYLYYNNNNESITTTKCWWLMTPSYYDNYTYVGSYNQDIYGQLRDARSDRGYAVRPVTSLKSCVVWKSGDGSANNPYEIEMNGGC